MDSSSCSYKKLKSVDIDIDIKNSLPDNNNDDGNDVEAALLYPTTKPLKYSNRCVSSSCLKKCLCVTLIVIGLLLTLAAIAGVFACKWFAGHVRKWTVEEPHPLPTSYISNKELQQVFKDEAKLFFDQIQADKFPEDLVVTQDIANGFAAQSDFLCSNMFAEMKPNQVTVTVSLPVDGFPGGKDRYLVGVKTLTWDPTNGLLTAKMVGIDGNNKVFYDFQFLLNREGSTKKWNMKVLSGELFGWTVPQEYIEKHENILEELYHCDRSDDGCNKACKMLEALDGISMEDGQVVFHGCSSDLNNADDMLNGHHRLLTKTAKALMLSSSSNYNNKPAGWKGQLICRLMVF